MKLFITTIFLFICSFTLGQTYQSIISKADAFYKTQEYQKSVERYQEAFNLEQKNGNDLYNAGCSAALSGNKKLAFKWLNLALKDGWLNVRHLKTDPDLISLHKDKRWNKLVSIVQTVVNKRESNYNKPLQAKLLAIYEDDQTIRQQYISALKYFGHQSRQADSLGRIMMFKDSINLIKVTEIINKYGWVGPDEIGKRANQALFLVVQHSNLETQKKYLPMMRKAVKNGRAEASSLALLEDRVALDEGRRQIYGSQICYDKKTKKYYVCPLKDPENVDKRRAKMGLGLLSNYVKHWGIKWNPEAYQSKISEYESKQKNKR